MCIPISQNINNLTLPSWSQKVFPDDLLTILEEFFCKQAAASLRMKRLYAGKCSRNEIHQIFKFFEDISRKKKLIFVSLTLGPFLNTVISNMNARAANESTTNFQFYSGHDNTIKYVTMALRFRTPVFPPFGSSLIFELRRKNNIHFVTVSSSSLKTT